MKFQVFIFFFLLDSVTVLNTNFTHEDLRERKLPVKPRIPEFSKLIHKNIFFSNTFIIEN